MRINFRARYGQTDGQHDHYILSTLKKHFIEKQDDGDVPPEIIDNELSCTVRYVSTDR